MLVVHMGNRHVERVDRLDRAVEQPVHGREQLLGRAIGALAVGALGYVSTRHGCFQPDEFRLDDARIHAAKPFK
ncbi:hypothetical protein GCM10022281_12210 [Sphingomonas rosea]|uniref:Uncharacterized protein n=1 Tax=Sphingomonas rosea TaxID=335605 RepID=A0ABP7U0L8_9SPHN